MTAPTRSAPSAETAVADNAPDSEGLDFQRVLEKSTSDVAITDLAKKGFKQVKVLNRKMILGLIGQAVDHVIRSRQELSKKEREKLVQESQARFDEMVKQKMAKERELAEIRARSEELQKQLEVVKSQSRRLSELENELERRNAEILELRGELKARGQPSDPNAVEQLTSALIAKLDSRGSAETDLNKLQSSIESLAERIARMGSGGFGGGGGGGIAIGDDVNLERLFEAGAGSGMESNVSEVKVKESKAGGVKNTLAKLKALQQGGAKDGE